MNRFRMTPSTGERMLRFVGDQIELSLRHDETLPDQWQARLRTNLGRADVLRHEIIHAHSAHLRLTDASWRDIPMERSGDGWKVSLPLTEVGYFECKAYAIDPEGRQHWPDGSNFGLSVHPDSHRTANTIYCAFPRMFGEHRTAAPAEPDRWDPILASLDKEGYTVIPPSGKLRDLIKELPHIIDTLGCRILHLLPVNSTPTTYARFGRFGSPYACQDLLDIDPALVEFDKRTTGIDQFKELAYATHLKGAKIFLDVVINHTGWGSTLQERHPQWFVRDEDNAFVSPGAWGVTWEDLAELHHGNPELWEHLSDVFLEWCQRGVDGFRCDAGYKIPVPAWRYITARVLDQFPNTIFLLEGLGGAWSTTEELLTTGAMQWAYSELFQNYSGTDIANYLDYSIKQSDSVGVYVHYSETHDNDRLAAKGRTWALLRNRLCALASLNGAFGFTCGVEWLATEKINVHQRRPMAWGRSDNLLQELGKLNQLLTDHPCFFDGAILSRLSPAGSPVYALSRISNEGTDQILVLVNNDVERTHSCSVSLAEFHNFGVPTVDLLGQTPPRSDATAGTIQFEIPAGQAFCLSARSTPAGLWGDDYRRTRAEAAWAITTICSHWNITVPSRFNWKELAAFTRADPIGFLTAVSHLDEALARKNLMEALRVSAGHHHYAPVVQWSRASANRTTLVPPGHYLLIEDDTPFRAELQVGQDRSQYLNSVGVGNRHVASVPHRSQQGDATLRLERYADEERSVTAPLRYLSNTPAWQPVFTTIPPASSVLLTNGIGGMARMQVTLGTVRSKYDCTLAANLHPQVPVDRHIFVKRVRTWIAADGFITPLDDRNLVEFVPGPPARWRFVASAGNDRAVEIGLTADMLHARNTTALQFERPATPLPFGEELPRECNVSLIVRCDIEDRSFHAETKRNEGADHHFSAHSKPIKDKIGFQFTPAPGRALSCVSNHGAYHHEAEWSQNIAHPFEATRGQIDHADAFSPGWFELPLAKGGAATLVLSADQDTPASVAGFAQSRRQDRALAVVQAELPHDDRFGLQLAEAVQAFIVRRDRGKTVVAGYPWFLDWGRDSLIAARGLLAAGLTETVRDLLVVFGRFAKEGTLPNAIHGEDASNRDTSDAPLWFGVVCEETAALLGPEFYDTAVNSKGRTIKDALAEIAAGYRNGTPNGIKMDPLSGLVWSPSHFTWMDTNHPASTPRQGYPVEIQVLWIRLLRQLERLELAPGATAWAELASRATASLRKLFWIDSGRYLADLLIADPGQPAHQATRDTALRSNSLFAVSLGLLQGEEARSTVQAATRHLLIPGAIRSLAPLPVDPPLSIRDPHGNVLNHPRLPYRGHYQGDEDTSRKLAYHNGTGWTWTLPNYCEALARAWEFTPAAVQAAKHYLASVDRLLNEGSLGQLPEIVDGDAPHIQRGCDAQAWSATETLRVWKLLTQR